MTAIQNQKRQAIERGVTLVDYVQRLMSWLTWLGVAPFIIALVCAAREQPLFGNSGVQIFITYSVVICCFMAGTLWGQAIDGDNRRNNTLKLLSSNAIALCVFATLLLAVDDRQMLVILSLCYLCALAVECLFTGVVAGRAKPYLTMRAGVTLVVIFLHSLAFAVLP